MVNGDIRWFSLGTAEKLLADPKHHVLQETQDLLLGAIYTLFERHIQASHVQFHHYCQPRQNESMQGKSQFDEKNKLTLEPVISELEALYLSTESGSPSSGVYLHLADANLDELSLRRPELIERLQTLVNTGHLKISGGVIDEAFIGPDAEEFSVAAIMTYFEKVIGLFGEFAVVPLVWIPERFFEEKTAAILDRLYRQYAYLQRFPFLAIIVDENVITHSLPKDWTGNVFSGWYNPCYPHLRIFVSSNHLRAIMPQATPAKVNEYFFELMSTTWTDNERQKVNEFLQGYEGLINRYDGLNQQIDEVDSLVEESLRLDTNRFYLASRESLEKISPSKVFLVDDLEKNGSWRGSWPYAFGEDRHFYGYINQSQNIFNPYKMSPFGQNTNDFQLINKIRPSSYKEFSIIWNNNPLDIEKWRTLTLQILKAGVSGPEALASLSNEELSGLGMSEIDVTWYGNFVSNPISWQQGQLIKYPEIRLNYILAQMLYQEIIGGHERDPKEIAKHLLDDHDGLGHLLHIWNKNRASCPNFIGFFGGASILFFRQLIAGQLASVLTLKYAGLDSFEKELVIDFNRSEIRWTLVKSHDIFKILDDQGDTVFCFSQQNLHNLVSGFSRHREGYNSIIQQWVQGRRDINNFALVETLDGSANATTSSHPLVIALDLERVDEAEIISKTYPEEFNDFDAEIDMLSNYPMAWEQIWMLPHNSIENPIVNYQEAYFGTFKWIATEKYLDNIEGRRVITFVRHALYQHKFVDIVKKIDPQTGWVKVEIWNRSSFNIQFNPTIAFPTSLDWVEGEAYSLEGEAIPIRGESRILDTKELVVTDRISNLRLNIQAGRDDVRYSASTVYTYQTSDTGAYTVSPQHLLILLSSREGVTLHPNEGYILDYHVQTEALQPEPIWTIAWDEMPSSLKERIQNFSKLFLEGCPLTEYQRYKLIYSRYPEIIFWTR